MPKKKRARKKTIIKWYIALVVVPLALFFIVNSGVLQYSKLQTYTPTGSGGNVSCQVASKTLYCIPDSNTAQSFLQNSTTNNDVEKITSIDFRGQVVTGIDPNSPQVRQNTFTFTSTCNTQCGCGVNSVPENGGLCGSSSNPSTTITTVTSAACSHPYRFVGEQSVGVTLSNNQVLTKPVTQYTIASARDAAKQTINSQCLTQSQAYCSASSAVSFCRSTIPGAARTTTTAVCRVCDQNYSPTIPTPTLVPTVNPTQAPAVSDVPSLQPTLIPYVQPVASYGFIPGYQPPSTPVPTPIPFFPIHTPAISAVPSLSLQPTSISLVPSSGSTTGNQSPPFFNFFNFFRPSTPTPTPPPFAPSVAPSSRPSKLTGQPSEVTQTSSPTSNPALTNAPTASPQPPRNPLPYNIKIF